MKTATRTLWGLARTNAPACATAWALACALGLAATPAAGGDRTASAGTSSPATLYHNYCSVCHGERGDGQSRAKNSLTPSPRDFTTAAALAELSRARMILATKEGRPGTAMVAWKTQLSDQQIEAVVDYVRNTFMRASTGRDVGRGRQLYAKTCAVCHGDRGAGSPWASANLNPPPRDFSAAAAKSELTRERMIAAVTYGRRGTAMAGFATQLPAEDIAAVVDYVRSAFMMVGSQAGISGTHAQGRPAPMGAAPAAAMPRAQHDHSAPTNMSLPMPFNLAGDARKGKTFYNGNCATCHGKQGDGQGPRAYFINPKPESFITAESRTSLTRPAIFSAVTDGKLRTEMPAWGKVLSRQQIADVSEYVFRAFVRQEGALASEVARRNGQAAKPPR